jgi:N-acetylglutamate synthase-like GNAT family acetyltransferase
MHIRPYIAADTAQIITLFYDTIHHINIRDYTLEQVNAWAPKDMNQELWAENLSRSLTYVAEADDQIIGFTNFETNGHLDCFYCHKDFQRVGVGSQLLATVEATARSLNLQTLFTEASITARPFFEANGFQVVNPQIVERRGQVFRNFVMEKKLDAR